MDDDIIDIGFDTRESGASPATSSTQRREELAATPTHNLSTTLAISRRESEAVPRSPGHFESHSSNSEQPEWHSARSLNTAIVIPGSAAGLHAGASRRQPTRDGRLRMPKFEEDGGISLAGGRPGSERDISDESGSTRTASTNPPPYFSILYPRNPF